MSGSLKDQLIALGLSSADSRRRHSKKQQASVRKGPPRKRSNRSGATTGQGAGQGSQMSLEQAYRLRANEEQKQANRQREQKLAEDRERREINRQIKAIVKAHRLNDPGAELARNFIYKQRIRKIAVTPAQLVALNTGELGVVYLSGGYHLMAPEHMEAVRQLSADHVPDLSGDEGEDGDHPVPDELVW